MLIATGIVIPCCLLIGISSLERTVSRQCYCQPVPVHLLLEIDGGHGMLAVEVHATVLDLPA